MKPNTQHRILYLSLALLLGTPSWLLLAQRDQRLPKPIDSQNRTILRGSRNHRVETLVSDGPVDDSARISGVTFRFKPAADKAVELERLLEDQQDPSSALYHAWLTPEEYGERFGLGNDDFAKVSEWIASQGFQVEYTSRSRTHISFSGTAAQVRNTFGTEVHRFRVDGQTHFSNVRDIEIPADLEPLIYTVQGLDDFPEESKAPITRHSNNNNGLHAVTPGDLAIIYNLIPLYKKGITGVGQKIVVTGQSTFNMQDIRDFREAASLPANDPKMILMPGSANPGFTTALGEALLDLEYAGGAAPAATIIYVYGTNANLAAEYAIDQNLAPVISHSWVKCEKRDSSWLWFRNLAQQAAAQGITWVAASGDTGPAGCESQSRDSAGVSGISVNLPASVPEVTAIGGTSFVEGTGKYWAATTAGDGTSALSYIPEKAWNDTAAGKFLSASGGGPSAAYARPSWQTGPGVPNINARLVPDISFTASWDHDPYLVVMSGNVVELGGTSAGTPFFAGVVALLNQYVVANGVQTKPGVGNINPKLYQLAQTTRGVFHDVTTGSNTVPCNAGTPDCTTGFYGYNAGPGYDQVTGLGSLDVSNFFESWAPSKSNTKNSTVVVSVEPSPVYSKAADADGYRWFYAVRVSETSGTQTKLTGFSMDDYDLSEYIADWFGTATLEGKGSLSVNLRSKDLPIPSDHIFVFSGVDTNGQRWTKQVSARFLGEQSGPGERGAAMTLTSNPAVVVKIGKGDPNCAPDHPYGQQLILKELNGSDVNLTKFIAGGDDYTGQIASWFGATRLPASGTLQANLCWQLDTVPVTLSYEMDGTDSSGRAVKATLSVDFKSFDQKSGVAPFDTAGGFARSVQPALRNANQNAVQDSPRGTTTIVPRPNGRTMVPLGSKRGIASGTN